MDTMDSEKDAVILWNLQMKNEYYWLIKHVDDEALENTRLSFDSEHVASVVGLINLIHADTK